MKVVITSMRNEANYILEWVAWNIMIGFDKVIIFTNHNDDDSIAVLKTLKNYGYVEYFELKPPETAKPQMYAFSKGIEWLHKNRPDWVSCMDVDEFLFLKEHSSIHDYIDSFPEDIDAIAINWKIFGSGNIEKKGLGLSVERFLMRAEEAYNQHYQFKSLFKYRDDLKRFHHRVFYESPYKYVYSNGKELTENAKNPGFNLKIENDNYINFDRAQINHYTIRSHEEFMEKMFRGNGLDAPETENRRHKQYLNKFDKNDVYEKDILKDLDRYIHCYEKIKKECDL